MLRLQHVIHAVSLAILRYVTRFVYLDNDGSSVLQPILRIITIIIIIMTRSEQPKPPAVVIVRQNGLSSASSRASVAETPMSRQIW